jgi:hypothetical protein
MPDERRETDSKSDTITITSPPHPGVTVPRDYRYGGEYTLSVIGPPDGKNSPGSGVVTVECQLSIAELLGGGSYSSGWQTANHTSGNWDNTFGLSPSQQGFGAAVSAKVSVDGKVRVSNALEDFDVMDDPGGDIDHFTRGRAPARAGKGWKYRKFKGTYDRTVRPRIRRITCLVERRYSPMNRRALTIADAWLFLGTWRVSLLVPTTCPAGVQDFLVVLFASADGLVVSRDAAPL